MSTSRWRMREASRSLAIAFNMGRAQEALFRVDEGMPLEDEDREVFEQLSRLFTEVLRGLEWTTATVEGAKPPDGGDSRALRTVSLVLPVIKNYPKPATEILKFMSEVSKKFSSAADVKREDRVMFGAVLGDLASHAGSKLDELAEERGAPPPLFSLPE